MSAKRIPEEVLSEWMEDMEEFTRQITDGLSEEKADQIQSMRHLVETLIPEVIEIRREKTFLSRIRYSMHRQMLRMEKELEGVTK